MLKGGVWAENTPPPSESVGRVGLFSFLIWRVPTFILLTSLRRLAETQPKLHPALLSLSAIISQYFRGIERLSSQFVPKKFQKLHKLLESVRDETIAHIDARSFQFKGLPANNVRIIIRDRQPLLLPHGVKFKATLIPEIRELATALERRMHEHSNKLVSEYPHEAPDDGEYLIDLDTKSLRRL